MKRWNLARPSWTATLDMTSHSPGNRASTLNPIAVVCAADDGFAPGLTVTIRSLLDNLRPDRRIQLYVIDGGIRSARRKKALDSWDLDRMEVEWLKPSLSRLRGLVVTEWFPTPVYLRLLIPDLLPQSVRRVIYLDCDTLVMDDVGKLLQMSLKGRSLGAVQDIGVPHVADGLPNYRKLGLSARAKYFNSGVLLIDLARWRKDGVGQEVISYVERHPELLCYPDQDGLNAVLAQKWTEISPRWNCMLHSYSYRSWKDSPYDRKTYFDLISRPHIIHFVAHPKPWTPGCRHPRRFLYRFYMERTRWSETH